MHYVYIIQSIVYSDQRYVGCTNNLKTRLEGHNSGDTPSTKRYGQWEFLVFFGFKNKDIAIDFESYLKSGTGKAFIAKRLLSLKS